MLLNSVFGSITGGSLTAAGALWCSLTSLALGFVIAWIYMYRTQYSKSFVVTLALLPVIVQAVIMLVNGNLGTGVAVMGAFSLIRFRSVPGSAREIGCIFFAMAVGLATSMGYLLLAACFVLLVGGALLLLTATRFGEPKQSERDLRITIPENLDYDGIFDDVFATYTNGVELLRVRTVNMGSLYELQYRIQLKGDTIRKEFIDELRCRNGNLTIVCGRPAVGREEL